MIYIRIVITIIFAVICAVITIGCSTTQFENCASQCDSIGMNRYRVQSGDCQCTYNNQSKEWKEVKPKVDLTNSRLSL